MVDISNTEEERIFKGGNQDSRFERTYKKFTDEESKKDGRSYGTHSLRKGSTT